MKSQIEDKRKRGKGKVWGWEEEERSEKKVDGMGWKGEIVMQRDG